MDSLTCTLQVFIDHAWRDAAALELSGQVQLGVNAATYLIYLPAYSIEYWGRTDAAALSINVPIDLSSYVGKSWPPFLSDLLPQGYGRIETIRCLTRMQKHITLSNLAVAKMRHWPTSCAWKRFTCNWPKGWDLMSMPI